MILLPVPEYRDIKKFHVSLILCCFLMIFHVLVEENKYVQEKKDFSEGQTKAYFNIQTKLYERHLSQLHNLKNKDQRLIASVLKTKEEPDQKYYSSLVRGSILDPTFNPLSISKEGLDQIEYADWLEVYSYMNTNLKVSTAYLLGVNQDEYGWDRWVSYLFVHVGTYHLMSNVLFLFLFGALIETLCGGLVVLIIFLGSGILAAPIYMSLTDLNQVSLVGASGGVCGLIAFYSIFNMQNKIRYWYWVMPVEKYYGFIQLSSGFLLVLWMLGDLAGYFSGVTFLDSVAYSAHLGGYLVGSLCALGLLTIEKSRDHQVSKY